MKYLLLLLVIMMTSMGFAQSGGPKPQKIIDIVYKVQKVNDKTLISFHRAPTIYEVGGDKTESAELLARLEESKKNQKPVQVTVDNKLRKILEVKGP